MKFLSEKDDVISAVLSKPAKRAAGQASGSDVRSKVKLCKAGEIYRTETTAGIQVFHGKLERGELAAFLEANVPAFFKNAVIETTTETITILANRKGKCTVLRKAKADVRSEEMRGADVPASFAANVHESADSGKSAKRDGAGSATPTNDYALRTRLFAADKTMHITETHNRQKNYLLKEGAPVANTPEPCDSKAQEAHAHPLEIVDFGCGKSYLTFAVYYYLTAIKGFNAHITGIDLKKDVIHNCERLAAACGYIGMEFICGDVADFSCSTPPDLVITLHACDTATDYALSYAVKNGAKCILSVPCCQHELNTLLKKHVPNDALSAMFKYGIIKERISALATDVMRAELLEISGYSTQILEFIDMEDTPKNLLIRAIKRDKPARNSGNAQKTAPTEEQPPKPHIQKSDLSALQAALGQTITLEKLLSQ